MIDILFCAMPFVNSGRPILAPAVLKSCAQRHGFSAATKDYNTMIFQYLKNHPHKQDLTDFFLLENKNYLVDEVCFLIDKIARDILKSKPRIVGLSLLTQHSQFFTWWLCYHLKYLQPNIHILIGGSGIKNFIADSRFNFANELKKRGMIDGYIFGDGEHSLIEYLKKNYSYPGINSDQWSPIVDLESLPYADFSDYDFQQYEEIGIPICDSRGCVRKCEFCDIIEHWKKYAYRSADHIFQEMLLNIKKFNISRFFFYNSLTNGNMKEFNKLLDMICEFNLGKKFEDQISWDGYFIIRNQKQHPEELWKKLKASNAKLQLGIESVIQHVRVGLGKNFTNEDIDYHLEMALKYNVPLNLLMIAAYPTETKDDFEFTKKWFLDRSRYSSVIKQVEIAPAQVLPGTRLEKNYQTSLKIVNQIPILWTIKGQDITIDDRARYLNELETVIATSGIQYNTADNNQQKKIFNMKFDE